MEAHFCWEKKRRKKRKAKFEDKSKFSLSQTQIKCLIYLIISSKSECWPTMDCTDVAVSCFISVWNVCVRQMKEKWNSWSKQNPPAFLWEQGSDLSLCRISCLCGHTNCWWHINGNSTLPEMLLAVCSSLHHPFHLFHIQSAKPSLWNWHSQCNLVP